MMQFSQNFRIGLCVLAVHKSIKLEQISLLYTVHYNLHDLLRFSLFIFFCPTRTQSVECGPVL